MRDFVGVDIERSSARAWLSFQGRLADRLVELGDGETVLVEVEVADDDLEGAAPYVQFVGFAEGEMVRGEVSSNAYLAAGHRLDAEQVSSLVALGWCEPSVGAGEPEGEGSANFFRDVEASEGDRLAVMTTRALRDVLGVAHPAFLICEGLGAEEVEPLPTAQPAAAAADEPLATIAEGPEELQALVDAALTTMFGEPPEKDPDGDIPVPYGSSLVFVRVEESAPVVHLFSVVVTDVTDPERARFEVNVLNRDVRFLKFYLSEDRIVAQAELPAFPFVPEHLRSCLAGMSMKLDEIDDDLAVRVGGRCALDLEDRPQRGPTGVSASSPDPSLPIELMALLELDVEGSGGTEPELAASLCHFDVELIVKLLRTTEEQEVSWRSSRDDALVAGDSEEAAACDGEMVAWSRTTAVLRRALRFSAEREVGGRVESSSRRPTGARSRRLAPRRGGCPPRKVPRPSRSRQIKDQADLLDYHGVASVEELDDMLTSYWEVDVDVRDRQGAVVVGVEGGRVRLAYPFTAAEFYDAVHELRDQARAEVAE